MKVLKKEEVTVDLQLLQEVVDYLQKQPYHEVNVLIQKIIIATNKEE